MNRLESVSLEKLTGQLDHFDLSIRRDTLEQLLELVEAGQIELPQATRATNVHTHTFFSYNAYGYSPTHYAWLARRRGLAVAGIVDFDVFDGMEEFLAAAKRLELKATVSMETRVYLPPFADRVINSPGEPGISYHMGSGFPGSAGLQGDTAFKNHLRETAQQRNRELIDRVNAVLRPLEVDMELDVLPLTPSGNPTERHICLAYARKARQLFPNNGELPRFWSDKLQTKASGLDLSEGNDLLELIRMRMMKR